MIWRPCSDTQMALCKKQGHLVDPAFTEQLRIICEFTHLRQSYFINLFNHVFISYMGGGVHTVAQLVEALRYKPESRGFDSRWCHWNFSLT